MNFIADNLDFLNLFDPELAETVNCEIRRQKRNIELIASENFVSPAVLAAAGTVLTNKYAEGYPEKRYYGGCECVDETEKLAIKRANALFGSNFANVQPHSGAQANMAVYFALLNPGDTVMSMPLDHGGHLTHGSHVNSSGILYKFIPYKVEDSTQVLDYDKINALAQTHKPKLIVAGASAYPRALDFEKFAAIAKSAGAYFMVDMAHIAGIVAAGLHQNPVPFADVVTTTTHKTLRGPRGGLILTQNEETAQKINKAVFPGMQGGPLMHIIAAKAVCFGEALKPEFKIYQKQVLKNAKVLSESMIEQGFDLISGGTDTHLMLADLRNFDITGKEMQHRLDEVYITANKNPIPNDPKSPFLTSGIRLGTPAVTSRGFVEEDMKTIAALLKLTASEFETNSDYIRGEVEKLCGKYPLYE
ncbi:MAG: serine hydroxymethyltransferase [Oscillospiraceae bacterium]|nr:serine hydroxymethyltransferase [Oscillospiraceae bacterium]